jgi:hypothetical protein
MDKSHKKNPEAPQVDANRRRLTKAGLAVPAVLGTLASRQVLGDVAYNCTPSGQISGNMSRPGAADCGEQGVSPTVWAGTQSWPAPYVAGMPADDQQRLVQSLAIQPPTPFSAVFADVLRSVPITQEQVTRSTVSVCTKEHPTKEHPQKTGECKESEDQEVSTTAVVIVGSEIISNQSNRRRWKSGVSPTLQQVLQSEHTDQVVSLARAAIASLLNAAKYAPGFPVSEERVIEMFNTVYNGSGQYKINDSTSWNAAQVQAYFESLYG